MNIPKLVRSYVERAVPPGVPVPRHVRIAQSGEMWQKPKPGGRSLQFTAVEELAVAEVAFSWRARFRIAPLVSMRVFDRYAAGEGLLEARLFGVPVMRRKGPEVAKGEALRYLAELAWAPHAMVANRELEWREVDAQTVEVATRVGSARVAARLEFDAAGDVVRSSGDARPRMVGKTTVSTPWSGSFSEYAALGGVRIPTRAEVRWELPDGPFTYWRGAVESVELQPAPSR